MSRSLRVAARFVQAAYFEVGSVVLYGKWKNHRGKIIKIDQDKWGNPTIEIEPIPKGRKKNKVMGLFKVWRADVKEKAMKELEEKGEAKQAREVVAKYLSASGIPLGKTFNLGSVRIHRYRDHFRIWDLTNAGKRGKKVKTMTLSVVEYYYKGDPEAWMENMSKSLTSYRSYDEVVKLIKDLQADYPHEISMNESEVRGIDVDPVGEKITLKTDTDLDIKAEPKEFLINSSYTFKGKDDKPFKQDTLYYSKDPKSAGIFYAWLKSNLSKVNKMDISALRKTWDELGVKYDYH